MGGIHHPGRYPSPALEPGKNRTDPEPTGWPGNNIARITTSGVISEFAIPTSGSQPIGIATGPDGNMWFTERAGNKIGQLELDQD